MMNIVENGGRGLIHPPGINKDRRAAGRIVKPDPQLVAVPRRDKAKGGYKAGMGSQHARPDGRPERQ